ncbi:MAG TPA: phage major capsid protein [Burkholderiaceae bacterium]|nr:phage major capsid protein [Burkholderiaceae bacterium]
MNLQAIREQRAGHVAEMRGLLAKAEGEKRSLTADEQTKFDALKASIEKCEADEARASFLVEAERRMMGTPAGGGDRSFSDLQSRVSVVDVIRAQMEGRSLDGAAREYHSEAERRTGRKAQGVFVPMAAIEQRVSTTSGAPEVVPTDHRPDQYIGPLRNALLTRRLGVRVLAGLSGNLSIPKHQTSLTAGWVAENAALTPSDMAFDSVTLAPKHAGGLTELSRQLIQQSSPDIEQLVRDDLAAILAQAIDSATILGGGANEPDGVLSSTPQTSSLATLSWANVLALLQKLDIVNAPAANIVASMKVKAKVAGTLKATGIAGYIYENGRIGDLPAYFSNQVPEKTGAPNTGRLIAGDWSQVLLGIWSEIDILANPYETTAFSKGSVQVRAMSTVDVAVRHADAFVVADDITI